jgi:prevent-host-death family protein
MERVVSAVQPKGSFRALLDKVGRGEQIVITRRGRRQAVLLSYEHLQTLREMARLAQDPEAVAAMRRSDEDVRRGLVYSLKGRPSIRRMLAASGRKRTRSRA